MNYPTVHLNKSINKVYVSFKLNEKRIRLYSGKRIHSKINPNSHPLTEREDVAWLLCAEVYKYIISGGLLLSNDKEDIITGKRSDIEYMKLALKKKNTFEYLQIRL